jgi:hypothetical protein
MRHTRKKYGYNALNFEAMAMQSGFWNFEPRKKSQSQKDYYSFPWFVDTNNVNLWNSFEIIDLQIYRRQEYWNYVEYMEQLEAESVNCKVLTKSIQMKFGMIRKLDI